MAVLVGLGVASLFSKELPALRRYLKIRQM
jgi:hypothetical protein